LKYKYTLEDLNGIMIGKGINIPIITIYLMDIFDEDEEFLKRGFYQRLDYIMSMDISTLKSLICLETLSK
jgi:hypothetical protein